MVSCAWIVFAFIYAASCCIGGRNALSIDEGTQDHAYLLQAGTVKHGRKSKLQLPSNGSQLRQETTLSSPEVSEGFGIPMAVFLGSCFALVFLQKFANMVQECSSVIAEFVGTFALVFTVGCCVITGSSLWNATAIACVLMVMVYATGPISGGHLNPAVTLSLAMAGKFEWSRVPLYCGAQMLAGIIAGSCYCTLFSPSSVNVALAAPFTWAAAFMVESIYTFML